MLVAGCTGFAGAAAGALTPALGASGTVGTGGARKPAKSAILFFLCGGNSHIDMWDMKPKAPSEIRGPFLPIQTSAPGVTLCEHLPLLAKQAHHLALINSVGGTVNTNDHHAGYYHNLTGHEPDFSFVSLGNNRTPVPTDWPYMGCVVGAKRPQHPQLPNVISLPYKPSQAPYTRPGQFAARLGVKYDPLYLMGTRDKPTVLKAPDLVLSAEVPAGRFSRRQSLLGQIDVARRDLQQVSEVVSWTSQQERAISLLSSAKTTAAFDVMRESEATRARYGNDLNCMSLLAARRLVEAEVPFITVFWSELDDAVAKKCYSGGGWDTHGNNFTCLKEDLLPVFDRGFSALIADLHERGLLDSTLLMVTSEMGRTPKIGDPRSGGAIGAGRDHWTHCLTDVLAGGGIRGGQVYGSSDRHAAYPSDKPVKPAHVTRTVYHAMGIEDLTATDRDGRQFHLLDEGEPLLSLF